MKTKFFETNKINEYITQIIGLAGEQCYLIEGNDRALLFDGLCGEGSLKSFVRELTDLPVQMVLSHAHPDHCGAVFEYGECYMHPDDMALLYTDFVSGRQERWKFVAEVPEWALPVRTKTRLEDITPGCAVKTYPVYDGDMFDLGGVQMEVIGVPGHTRGSIVLLDRADRLVLSGDAINPNTLMALPGAATVEEYKESVLHLKTFQPAFDSLYGGHGPEPVPARIVYDALMLIDRILNRTDEAIEEYDILGHRKVWRAASIGSDFLPLYGGFSNIVYHTDTLINEAARGAEDAGATVEYFDLFKLDKYTGCVSCFGCKKEKNKGRCIRRDGLTPVLDAIREADGLIIGSPNYLSNLTASFRALYERLIFQNLTYNMETPCCNVHPIPVLLIMTSNAPDTMYTGLIESYQQTMNGFVGPTKVLISGDTLQLKDYSKTDWPWTLFDAEAKQERHDCVFPEEMKKAYEMGKALV